MKAALYERFGGEIAIEDLPDPICPETSVIIEVKASGICRSDWHGWMGHDDDIVLPHVPGHEFTGVVVEKGSSVTKISTGDRVVVPFCCGCGTCKTCKSGKTHICDHYFQPGFTSWGSFAEFVRVDFADANVQILPDSISFETGASLGCRFMTAFRAVKEQAKINKNQWVSIFGCGGVGLSAVMIAKAIGANIIAFDLNRAALDKAVEFGADHTFIFDKKTCKDLVKKVNPDGMHASIDAIGKVSVIDASFDILAKNGRHVQVGLIKESTSIETRFIGKLIANELEFVGSHGMPVHTYPVLFEMIVNKQLDPSRLIGEKTTLSMGCEYLQNMDRSQQTGIQLITEFV